ncbi:MAG: hypothetical protein IPM29_23670 [Planctomycetes bacterium]|nr:hypothetical protein [Planctomycetota bacterium]
MKQLSFLLSLLALACSAQDPAPERPAPRGTGAATPQDHAATELAARVTKAKRLLDAGSIDEALLETDAILKDHPGQRDALLLAARGNIALFEQRRQFADSFLADAVTQLRTALDERDDERDDDPDTQVLLSWCLLKQSEFREGYELALQAADAYRAAGAPPEKLSNALLQAGEHRMQMFVDAWRAERDSGEERPSDDVQKLAQETLQVLANADAAAPNALARQRMAQVYQWLDRPLDAIRTYEDGIRAIPDAVALHTGLQDLYFAMDRRAACVQAYRNLLKDLPGSTAVQWYLGRAQVALGDDLRGKSQWEPAARAYADALASYTDYDAKRPGDHAGTSQWIAICQLSLGRVAFESGDLDAAREHYFAAYDACPPVADTDENGTPRVYDSFGGNYVGGLARIGQTLAEGSGADALPKALTFFEAVLARHPDRFSSIYNNAALAARDLGVRIWEHARNGEAGATPEQAMALWEKSYGWYEKAVQLAPDDPQIANDCGLMLLYHLGRDLDHARELFDRAVQLGTEQLAALPADASDSQRHFIEGAVGDALQNIGKLLLDDEGKPEEAKAFLERSLQYYPYQQREARRMLERATRGPEAAQPDARLVERFEELAGPAREAVADPDAGYEEALSILDEGTNELRDYAPFMALYGEYTLRFAEQRAGAGGNAAFVAGLFDDAVRNLRRAVELDAEPIAPRLSLASALQATGDFREAASVCDALMLHAQSLGGTDADTMQRIHAIRADCAARAYVAAKSGTGGADEDLLRMARASYRELEGAVGLDDAQLSLWTSLERWAGAPAQALEILGRAAARDERKVEQLRQLGLELGDSQPVLDALAGSDSAYVLYYRGCAGFDRSRQLWASGEAERGIGVLDDAIADLRKVIELRDDYRNNSEYWIALCMGQKGFLQLANGDLDGAGSSFVEAAKFRPDVANADLGSGQSIRRGILLVGDRYYGSDLGTAVAFYRNAFDALPDDDQIANNLGLFARDHATNLVRNGRDEDAAELFEVSYTAYTRASALKPDDVRLRNDRAVLLVYYLHRDYPTAIELFEGVIRDGTRMLTESPPTDPDELRNLQEAVGDAYGNLGYHYMTNVQEYAKARPNLEKSLEYYPFQERASTRLLQRLTQLERGGN